MDPRTQLIRQAHAVARELDMDHVSLSARACVDYDVNSMAKLTMADLRDLVRELSSEYTGLTRISKTQESTVYRLGYVVLKWVAADILKFIHHQLGYYKGVQYLSKKEAKKVITGLEGVARHKGLLTTNYTNYTKKNKELRTKNE